MNQVSENVPIELSASSKRNAYYTHCNAVGHCRAYAVCLHLIEERKHGRIGNGYEECSAHIGQKRCPAIAMRKEEVAAGKALYFVDRQQSLVTTIVNTAQRVVAAVKEAAKPRRKSKTTVATIPMTTDYAVAITAAVKDSTPTPAPKMTLLPGETLLDAVRRLSKRN